MRLRPKYSDLNVLQLPDVYRLREYDSVHEFFSIIRLRVQKHKSQNKSLRCKIADVGRLVRVTLVRLHGENFLGKFSIKI